MTFSLYPVFPSAVGGGFSWEVREVIEGERGLIKCVDSYRVWSGC